MVAGEVPSGKSLLPAMLISVLLVASVYVLPLMVITGVLVHGSDYDYSKWVDGYLAIAGQDTIKQSIGGSGLWMCYLIAIGSCTAQFGQLFTLVCTTSRALYVMGLLGTVPSFFSKLHSRWHTPWVSLLTLTCFTAIFAATLNFNILVDVTIAFYGMGIILRVCAFLTLRITQPNLYRPYKFGGNNLSYSLLVFLCLPCIILSSLSIIALEKQIFILVFLIFSFGFIIYGFNELLKKFWPQLFYEEHALMRSINQNSLAKHTDEDYDSADVEPLLGHRTS